MKNNFFTELKKIKNLYNSNLKTCEYIEKLGEFFILLGPSLNLGKMILKDLNGEYIVYENDSSTDFYQIESQLGSDGFLNKYFPVEGHEFNELELEKIELLNEIIVLLFSKGFDKIKTIEEKYQSLIDNDQLNEYSFLCMNLSNYNYLKNQLGEKTSDFINVCYSKLLGLLDSEEELFMLEENKIVALIKKENVKQFLKFKQLIDLSFEEFNIEQYSLCIKTGVYNINKNEPYDLALENASIALYMAEHTYKTNDIVFKENMKKTVLNNQKILSLFPNALKNDEFCVYYQPKVDLTTNSMYGSEALVRWSKGDRIILPGEFIPVLERENVLYKLDFYVLEQVCKDMRKWLDSGMVPVKTSINISKKNIRNVDFIKDLMRILKKYQIESKYIEIELTETTDNLDTQNLVDFVKMVQQNNIKVSIDDFGVGYSSLSLIKNLSANIIKIDKSFIDNIEEKKDFVVVKNIINIASELDIEVIAEGIETAEQIEILQDMGCNKIQGYYFDRPLPKEEFEKRLENKKFYSKQMTKKLN